MKAICEKIQENLARIWMVITLVLFVFYMENQYFNLIEAKAFIYDLCALIYICASLLCMILSLYETSIKESFAALTQSWNRVDSFVVAFGITVILSNVMSNHPEEAFTGGYGWKVGTFYLISLCIIYFIFSRTITREREMLMGIGIVCGLQFLWVILNGFYVDPLLLHQGLSSKDYMRYVGTIGNTNWYVGYVVMLVPFFLFGTFYGKGVLEKVTARVLLVLATMSMISCNAQGVYLGLFAIGIFYVIWALHSQEAWVDACINGICFAVGAMILGIMKHFMTSVDVDGVSAVLCRFPVSIGMMTVFALLAWGSHKISQDRFLKMRKGLLVVWIVGIIIGIVAGVISQAMIFNDSWGTNRGRTWRVAIESFMKQPIGKKLFGVGPACFGYEYLAVTGSNWVRNVHNEYLEYLITTGIVGAISYLGLYVSVGKSWLSKVKKHWSLDGIHNDTEHNMALAAGLAVLGYAGQAIVNNPQALNGAIFVIFLGIYRRSQKRMI